jgi:adenosylhomocysteinase
VRPHADEYVLAGGQRVILLAEGRVVNLVAAEGSPPAVMDLSFAAQALALARIAGSDRLAPGVYDLPAEIDAEIASLTLASLGARIDSLSPAQQAYLASWSQGS